jgi:hypothetical protein
MPNIDPEGRKFHCTGSYVPTCGVVLVRMFRLQHELPLARLDF